MKQSRRVFAGAVLLGLLLIAGLGGCTKPAENANQPDGQADAPIRIASLKGPTTMGLVQLMSLAEKGDAGQGYQFEMYGTADEMVPKLVNKEFDMALLPCNLASVLFNKTKGALQVAAVNTLGVLYVVETGDTIHSVADLAGKTVYSTGKGTTPEYALRYILNKNGLNPEKDLTIEYKSEATELAVMLAEKADAIAVLPQPYVAVVQMQNPKVRVALSLTDEWERVGGDSQMVTGVLIVQKDFAEKRADAVRAFLKEYKASIEFVNQDPKAAAELVAQYGIVPKAAIAEKAIPACHITYLTGDAMQKAIGGYLQVLFEADPKSVGGALPGNDFYYKP